MFSRIKTFLKSKSVLDTHTFEALREILISADMNWRLVDEILNQIKNESLKTQADLDKSLRSHLLKVLEAAPKFISEPHNPLHAVLLVGLNGAGKTTTLAKLALYYRLNYQKESLWAAGDTFRSAAVEQLEKWANQLDFKMVKGAQNSDSAGVVYDAYQACLKNQYPVLLADTAGRMHSSDALMRELKKIQKVLNKQNPHLKPQVLMVLDATLGQSMVGQVKTFREYVDIHGLIMTKLDAPSKGGALFGIVSELKIPIAFLGFGESVNDFLPFQAKQFVDQLFDD